MKISILPFTNSENTIDKIMLYNLIKRAEEDLLAASALLREFYLEIRLYPTFLKYQKAAAAYYSFTEDDTAIHLMIPSYYGQEAERVYEVLKHQLLRIKKHFYV